MVYRNRYTLWSREEDEWLINNYGGLYGCSATKASFRLRRSYQGTLSRIHLLGLRRDGQDWRVEPECRVAMWRMGVYEERQDQAA